MHVNSAALACTWISTMDSAVRQTLPPWSFSRSSRPTYWPSVKQLPEISTSHILQKQPAKKYSSVLLEEKLQLLVKAKGADVVKNVSASLTIWTPQIDKGSAQKYLNSRPGELGCGSENKDRIPFFIYTYFYTYMYIFFLAAPSPTFCAAGYCVWRWVMLTGTWFTKIVWCTFYA